MALQATLILADESWQRWLQAQLGEAVVVSRIEEEDAIDAVATLKSRAVPDLMFVVIDHGEAAAALIEAVRLALPSSVVVGLSASNSADSALAAVRAGAVDVLVRERDDDRVLPLVEQAWARRASTMGIAGASTPAHDGQVTSLISASQSPILAFLGLHLAFVLEHEPAASARVLLVDLSGPGGDAAILSNQSPEFGVLDVLDDIERFDETLIETAFPRLSEQLYLLTMPETDVERGGAASFESLTALLSACRTQFDHVLLCMDGGSGLDALCDGLSCSDRALLLSDPSVVRSRQNKALIAALRQRNALPEALQLVVTDYRDNAGITGDELANALGIPLLATIGGRLSVRSTAMNRGASMFEHAPSDTFSRNVQTLAAELFGIDAMPRAGMAAVLRRVWRR